jgi:serine/threonine protein kinase
MEFLSHANYPHNKQPTKSLTPILLAQGTYGCVYYPGFTCKGSLQKTKYITKLQKNDETLENELEIGEKIQKIKHYKNYFAPILKQCPVSLYTIQKKYAQSLNKCKVIKESLVNTNKQQDFNINKIRYILGDDLEKTFQQISNSTPNQTNNNNSTPFHFLIDTYQYLSKSLKKLKKQNILHYDLKANNIIYDKESDIPIIIDFGLSVSLDNINPTAPDPLILANHFFDTYKYDYWCLQPIFIGLYADFYYENKQPPNPNLNPDPYQQPISPLLINILKKTIKDYIE